MNRNKMEHRNTTVAALLALSLISGGCGSDDDATPAAAPVITLSERTLRIPAEGGTATIDVETTWAEWTAYTGSGSFVSVSAKGTTSAQGTIDISVAPNPTTEERTDSVCIASGSARTAVWVSQAAAEKASYYAPEGYRLVWHDEFDSGTELNPADWTHEVQGSGWVNNELQNYVDHLSPAGRRVTELRNGRLRINCFEEDGKVYSGRVYAHVKTGWTYGYIEASIKLPSGRGTWPAFWMMPVNFTRWPDDGEIDIMEEVGVNPNYVSSSLHATGHVHTNNTQVTHEMLCPGAEGEFHTYAIEWTATNITTYVDGQVQLSYDNRGLGRTDWPYDDPFYVILNLAWGGSWGGMKGVDPTALPVTMEVDYVRVFQK